MAKLLRSIQMTSRGVGQVEGTCRTMSECTQSMNQLEVVVAKRQQNEGRAGPLQTDECKE